MDQYTRAPNGEFPAGVQPGWATVAEGSAQATLWRAEVNRADLLTVDGYHAARDRIENGWPSIIELSPRGRGFERPGPRL
jgi:hypothetical protein